MCVDFHYGPITTSEEEPVIDKCCHQSAWPLSELHLYYPVIKFINSGANLNWWEAGGEWCGCVWGAGGLSISAGWSHLLFCSLERLFIHEACLFTHAQTCTCTHAQRHASSKGQLRRQLCQRGTELAAGCYRFSFIWITSQRRKWMITFHYFFTAVNQENKNNLNGSFFF